MVDLPHVDTCADGERQRVGSPPSARLTIQIVDALREDLSPVLANSGFTVVSFVSLCSFVAP